MSRLARVGGLRPACGHAVVVAVGINGAGEAAMAQVVRRGVGAVDEM